MKTLRFQSFELDPELGILLREREPVELRALPFRLLLHLARNANRVVSRDELRRAVWQDVHVSESALEQAARSLRIALGPDAGLLDTERGRGYRLNAAVEIVHRAPAHDPLLAREPELARLDTALADARCGRGGLALLTGEPGIGKSRLLREVLECAEALGVTVALVRCPEGGASPPLWVFEDLLDQLGLGAAMEAADGEERLEPRLRQLRRQRRIVQALLGAAARNPLLAAIDDLQRADRASWELLQASAVAAADAPLLVLGAVRNTMAEDDTLARIAQLLRAPSAWSASLERLGPDHVAALAEAVLGRALPPAPLAVLHQRSGGNPFLLRTLLRVASIAGDVEASIADPSARTAIEAHLEVVPEATRAVLRAASVLGRVVDLPLLAAITDRSLVELHEQLATAKALHVLEPDQRPDTASFAHGLLAEVLRAALPEGERLRLHARAAEALARAGQASAAAYHAERAAPVLGAGRAAELCSDAATAATERQAPAEAARWWRSALALADPADLPSRLVRVLALGESLARAGSRREAETALDEAIELARATRDDLAHARAVLAIAELRVDDPDIPEPAWIATLEEALSVHDAPTAEHARLLSRLAFAVWFVEPRERARKLAEESVALARRLDDADTLGVCLVRAHRVCQTGPENVGESFALSRELAALMPRIRDPMVALGGGLPILWDAIAVGDPQAVQSRTEQMRRAADRLGLPHAEWHARIARVSRASLNGRFEAAELHAQRALAVGREAGIALAELTFAIQMLMIRGDQERLAELEPLFAPRAPRSGSVGWRVSCALVRRAAGDDGDARRLLRELTRDGCAAISHDLFYADVVRMLAELAVTYEDERAAADCFEALWPFRALHAVGAASYCHRGSFARPLGALATALGRWDEAEALLDEGLRRDRHLGATPFIARGLLDHARLCERRGHPGDAQHASRLRAEAATLRVGMGLPREPEGGRTVC